MASPQLIDESNFAALLVQSSQARSGTPDGNVFFDMANNRIQLITVEELATINYGHTSAAVQIDVVAAARTFTRASGSFLTDGFGVGQSVTFSGFTNGGNNATKVIEAVTATVITVTDGTGLVDETGSGDEQVTNAVEANPLTNDDGITLRALYNFENQERRVDESLRTFLRASRGVFRFAGAFAFISGNKLDTANSSTGDDRTKIRGSGWSEYADTAGTLIDRIYHGVRSLNPIDADSQPYYALAADTLEATLQAATWTDFARVGPIDEAVQVYGDTANGDAGAGNFDSTALVLVARVRKWGNNYGETTSVASGIGEFSGFSAGYGVGETVNTNNTYALADVFGGAQIAPWTGMTLERLAVSQTETGFNEADGDFQWVLHNTLGGTVQECAAYLDALALQDADVDAGAGTYNGRKGRVWYTRNTEGKVVTASIGGEGLFIENLPTSEQQGILFTADDGATRSYPFYPEIRISVGAQALADPLAWYHVYYVDGAAAADFDAAGAVTVEDKDANPIKGNVQADQVGGLIVFPYAYATNNQAGLAPNTDKAVVVEVEGDGVAAQAITYFTITNDAIVAVTCQPPAENNA